MVTLMNLRGYAKNLIEMGFDIAPVFAVDKSGKCACGNPNCYKVGKHLYNITDKTFGTKSLPKLEELVRFHQHANLAVMTGLRSKLAVIDVDRPAVHSGAYARLVQLVPELQSTMSVETGSGGFHFYFRLDDHMHSKTNQFGLGIDFLAEGAYAISPGSTHRNGCTYSHKNQAVPVELPDTLIALTKTRGMKCKT